MDHRPGEWRSRHGWKLKPGGSRGLSQHLRAGGICLWIADWDFFFWQSIQRAGVDQTGVCFRAGDEAAQAAAVPSHAPTKGVRVGEVSRSIAGPTMLLRSG